MTQTAKHLIFFLLAPVCSLFLHTSAFAQADSAASSSVVPSNSIATGHSYFGIDLGITGSDYIGSQNFLWSIQQPNVFLGTYVPFSSLGTGIGFVGGFKGGIAINSWFDLEAKLRFMTNHTSNSENSDSIILSTYHPATPTPPTASATNEYSLTLSNIDFALLGHFRLSDQLYAIGGFSVSGLIGNSFSTSQLLNQNASYLRQNTHTIANVAELGTGDSSLVNWFYGYRGDLQIGIGSVVRLSAESKNLLDYELLFGIPLTRWLTKVADSSLNNTAQTWLQPTSIIDPHLWYATLTIGFRLTSAPPPPPLPPDETNPPIPPTKPVSVSGVTIPTDSGFMLTGHVTDAKTGKPISADMTAIDLSNNQILGKSHTDSSGNYSIHVNGPGKYSVTANAPGHLFGSAYFEVDSEGRVLKSHTDIALGGLTGGKTRLLIFFDFDKADLQPSSTPELNRAVDMMQNVPTMKVEIAGYSDSVGELSHNIDLSLRRANSVRDYLIKHGISSERITARGYGPVPPIAPNDTEEGRATNRRVEFVVKEQ